MQVQALRDENFQLKNEITDLKNAFDLNRDILRILSSYNHNTDPQLHLLLQIITRLTSVNNQVMLNGIEYVQQKSVLKQENLRLNLMINELETKLEEEIQRNRISTSPNESRLLMHQQFNSLSKEIMAANEERIIKDQEIQYWKDKYTQLLAQQSQNTGNIQRLLQDSNEFGDKIKRRFTSQTEFKYRILYMEMQKENKRLERYISELQSRLMVFIKVYNLQEEVARNLEEPYAKLPRYFDNEREEIRLLKYALNDIQVEKKEDEYILTITQRYREKDTMNNQYFREKRSLSWPKHQGTTESTTEPKEREGERDRNRERGRMMEERQQ